MQDDAAAQNHALKVSSVTSSTANGSDIKLDGVFASGNAEPLVSLAEQNGRYDDINNVITSLSRMNVSSLPAGNGITSIDQGSNFWVSQGVQGFQSEDGSNGQLHVSSGNSSAVLSSPNLSQLMANQMPAMVGDGMQQVGNKRPITGQQQLLPPGVAHNQAMFNNQQNKMWPPSFQQQQQALLSQNQQNITLQNWMGQNMSPDVAFQRFFPRLNVPSFDKKSFSYTPDLDMSAVLNAQGSKYGRSTSLPGQYGNFAPRMGFDALNIQSFDGHFDNGGSYYPYNKVRTPDVSSFAQLESMRYHMNDGSDFNNHSDLDGFKASHQQQHYRGPSDGHLKGVRYNNFPEVPVDRSLIGLGLDLSGASGDPNERYSRKVFVGGLPPDIDEAEITAAFCLFGSLIVDWPHKAESKSYFPPKGYCFLIFREEFSVRTLAEKSMVNDGKLYWCVSSPTMKDKPVQIRPWCLADSDFVLDASQPLDPRKTIFVGGVPRPLKALELAMIMDRLYGGVCYAGIDTDPELKYPKGAGRIAFSSQQSYINAISARFIQLQHGDIDKRVEVKPYVLDDQLCDECQGAKCGGKFAPFFCANVTCLQYYCEHCWAQIHSHVGREYHKPLVKEGADRPRAIPFRWGQGGGAGFSQAS